MPNEFQLKPDVEFLPTPEAIYPVILSGGAGTRLWPMSRTAYPKQLLALTSDLSLLQETARRVTDSTIFRPPLILASEENRFNVAEQLRQAGLKPDVIMLEPVGRNTAPAAAAAAIWLEAVNPNALMLVMPSDHVIEDESAFRSAIEIAASVAVTGMLVTFGIDANRPEAGCGYIRLGPELWHKGVFGIEAFVEKSDAKTAEGNVAPGQYIWNSGIFLFPAALYLEELGRYYPEMIVELRKAVTEALCDLDFVRLQGASFAKAANQSIEFAVMERTTKAAVVPVSMGWTDVGAWDDLWTMSDKSDENGLVTVGDVVAVKCKNSYLRSEEKLVAAYGLENMIVISTVDAILVAPMSGAQDINQLVRRLQTDRRSELTHSATVYRPWGTYRSIHAGERAQVKHIMVSPGQRLSLQMHHHRAEHWIVVMGTAKVVRGSEELLLTENQSTYIPLGTIHRLENPGVIPLHLIEVQSGSYLGENDIVRFEDAYGRNLDAR